MLAWRGFTRRSFNDIRRSLLMTREYICEYLGASMHPSSCRAISGSRRVVTPLMARVSRERLHMHIKVHCQVSNGGTLPRDAEVSITGGSDAAPMGCFVFLKFFFFHSLKFFTIWHAGGRGGQ